MSNKLPEPVFEGLEPRLLLTTLVGGDVFEYQDANENIVRIALEGDIIAEFIAADVDPSSSIYDQSLIVGDLPGLITFSEAGRTGVIGGGIGGADGIQVIGPTAVEEPTGFDADNTNFDALASRDAAIGAGQTFGFTTGTANYNNADHAFIQLAQLSNTDGSVSVQAYLQQATLGQGLGTAGTDEIALSGDSLLGVVDMAVNPITGLGYAVTNSNLFSIDLNSGTVTDLGAITNTDAAITMTNVMAMAFDSAGDLWILTTGADAAVNTQVSLVKVSDPGTASFLNADSTDLLLGGSFVTATYAGLAINPNSGTMYAVTAGGVLHSWSNPGAVSEIGTIEGAVIESLAFSRICMVCGCWWVWIIHRQMPTRELLYQGL